MATATLDTDEKKAIKSEFDEVVNMSASQLEKWLKTEESKSVGQTKEGDDESIGHQSGEKIIDILGKKSADLSESDYAHMRKVVSYVRRHSAQRPKQVAGSNWAYSLKNWGHDPDKK
ncbi:MULTISPECIES: DUF3140 domain-containing protein [Spirosoma]|uniref:DUF3140 domain-containing protein n=1 Tax=Spirosoma sordidisoli TaxID=2502893 RepID=A0A4Q2URF4_9BACT|nr:MULTISPECIES: DUF3140 domain-containing protein [Spirosoma]RYC70250.1 DUF3140 domain-containing protein [Spirosoma sordidisoli]